MVFFIKQIPALNVIVSFGESNDIFLRVFALVNEYTVELTRDSVGDVRMIFLFCTAKRLFDRTILLCLVEIIFLRY